MFSLNTWVWQAFSDTKVSTVNLVWENSLEYCSWMGSGHTHRVGASQVTPHPVPAQRGFSCAITTASQSHTHALYFQSWSFECGCHLNVPPLCCAPLFPFVLAHSFWRWAWEICGHLSPSGGGGGGVLTRGMDFSTRSPVPARGHKISQEETGSQQAQMPGSAFDVPFLAQALVAVLSRFWLLKNVGTICKSGDCPYKAVKNLKNCKASNFKPKDTELSSKSES